MPLKLVRVKGSQNWYIRGTVARVPIFESTRTSDRSQADAFRLKVEHETWEREQLGLDKRKSVTFAYAASCYGLTKSQKVRDSVLPALDYFKEKPIDQIGQSEIDKGAQAVFPNCKASTRIRQFYTPVLCVLNHASAGGFPGATSVRVKKPRVAHVERNYNTDHDVACIISHSGNRLRAIILFMTQTGVRVGEAVRLTRQAFTMKPGFAIVGKTKNGKPRMVPLTEEARAAIDAIMPEEPFARVFGYKSRYSVNTALTRACRRAGLPKTSPHKIGRHSFAARLLANGESLKTVQQAGGWESIQVVAQVYGHLEQSTVDEAILRAARGGRK